ncbi:DUF3806 domain-containing protein [Roseateles oligotrophus]|uniref:DUF3806 domain-containing protein n=1 Tax=Roseateles oligotrophus TaxID=1769250 RepID=A0ABT2YE72_9BURK|nr:DUF3806 domain-containing protein [Roseateles oligotrophus]MCV2368329.1 DUF3806 domain-containing protein [Roseateles oligotrophus]
MQRIHSPNEEDTKDVEAKRDWVRNHFEADARHKYETLEGKLQLLDTILSNEWIKPAETLKLQCLGITFGDALAQKLGMHWVAVEDEYGRDPALRFENSSVLSFPLTAISKRIERGESVNVNVLFSAACEMLLEARQDEA